MAEEENGKNQPSSDAAAEDLASPAGSAGPGPGKAGDAVPEHGPRVDMSDSLKKALEEAEAHVEKAPGKTDAGTGEGPAEEALPAEAAPAKFDPNKVAEVEAVEKPAAPSPKELELRMQILELRQKLREAEGESEKRVKEIKLNKEQAQHIQAQFDSYKARVMKEKADTFNYGHEPLLKEMLAVVDNLERALTHAGENLDPASVIEGVNLILRQMKGLLEKFGVKEIMPLGEPFNPEFHQAMMQTEDREAKPNTVVQVHQKGYLLKDRLLRAAMVVVSKGPGKQEEETDKGGK
jgi:molecular chaperone GrpE